MWENIIEIVFELDSWFLPIAFLLSFVNTTDSMIRLKHK